MNICDLLLETYPCPELEQLRKSLMLPEARAEAFCSRIAQIESL